VPLSEEELRLLEQMERALVAEDPKLASTLRGTRLRKQARRQLILGVVVFVVGVGLLMAGAVLAIIPLGILGFVVMLGSAYLTLVSWRGQKSGPQPGAAARDQSGESNLRVVQGGKSRRPAKASSPKHGSLMERFEERWRRRREQNGGY
jgi:Protein of unknown function (DUF3040)